jgi:hypothetical protein
MVWFRLRSGVRVAVAAAVLLSGVAIVAESGVADPVSAAASSPEVRLMNGGTTPTVTAPATLTANGMSVHYPVVISGFSAPSLSATISVPDGRGTFSFATTSGVTAMFGYPSTSAVPASGFEIGFFGDNAAVTSILADHIFWTGGNTGDVTVSVVVTAYEEGVFFNPDNGHYYEYVAGPVSWFEASNSAATEVHASTSTPGYLVTITSESENDFIASKVNAPSVWIGATDDYAYINAAVGQTLFANQTLSEGKWHWVTGPETGFQFWEGDYDGVTVSGRFAAWAVYQTNGEPNSSGNCGLTNWGSPLGRWDDQPCTFTKGYLVEYGPLSNPAQAVSLSVAATVAAPAILTVEVSGNGTVSSSPAGIECGVSCSAQFVPGVVTLSAIPGAGQRLESWGSPCSGSGVCVLSLNSDQTVSATFGPIPVVVETPTTTTVALPVPPSSTVPVPAGDPDTGQLPSLSPGEFTVIENGVATSVEVSTENGSDLVMRGTDFELRLSGQCSSGCSVQTNAAGRQILQLDSQGAVQVAGEGFQPGSVVYVWLFSTPQLLGELTVGADGAFSGALPLIGVEVGEHTLQVSGVNLNGLVRTANLGVIVDAPDVTENLPSTGQSLGAVKWMIVMLAFGGMLLAARRRQVA